MKRLLAALALIVAGCGSAPAEKTTTGAGKPLSQRDKAMKFSACMRANGVKAFPDPDASGELTIDAIANGTSLDTDSAVFKQAIRACKDLEPAGFTGRTRTPQQQSKALRFAQCIRDNGVKDFPDPTKGAPLIDTRRIPSTSQPGGMAALKAAMEKCSDYTAGLVKRP